MIARRKKHVAPLKRRATPFDKAAGQIIRKRRHEAQLSQQALAQQCGVAFQQLQKYEKGTNRIALGRFVRIAKALGAAPSMLLGEIIHAAGAP